MTNHQQSVPRCQGCATLADSNQHGAVRSCKSVPCPTATPRPPPHLQLLQHQVCCVARTHSGGAPGSSYGRPPGGQVLSQQDGLLSAAATHEAALVQVESAAADCRMCPMTFRDKVSLLRHPPGYAHDQSVGTRCSGRPPVTHRRIGSAPSSYITVCQSLSTFMCRDYVDRSDSS
jgi:hypothetical protein